MATSCSPRTTSPLAAIHTRVAETVAVTRPPEAVWAVVADPRNDPRWCRAVRSVVVVDDGRWRVMHKPIPLRPPRRLELEHVEVEPPRRLLLRQEDAAAVSYIEYRLEATPTGTRFTQVSQFAWKGVPRRLHGTFERAVRREVRRQLQALCALLDGDAAVTSLALANGRPRGPRDRRSSAGR
jgi:uncharacterized protein YndB with AHSA1/START domain